VCEVKIDDPSAEVISLAQVFKKSMRLFLQYVVKPRVNPSKIWQIPIKAGVLSDLNQYLCWKIQQSSHVVHKLLSRRRGYSPNFKVATSSLFILSFRT